MRRPDNLIDPEIAAELDAIDATLAGEPVDPKYAELAELALLIADGRPQASTAFAGEMDERARTRFAGRRSAPGRRGALDALGAPKHSWLGRLSPKLATVGVGLLATVGVVVALSVSGGAGPQQSRMKSAPQTTAGSSTGAGTSKPPAAALSLAAPAKPETGASNLVPTAKPGAGARTPAAPSTTTGAAAPSPQGANPGSSSGPTVLLAPPNNGRKVIQAATLNLGAAADRIDDVAQQVFNVVGTVNGIVDSSSVTETGGLDGNAQFQLRVPSASLSRAMTALSRLKYARVLLRTDNTQDVNSTYVSAQRRLADATALRSSLLKQLQAASTQQQTDSLKAQIRDAEASMAAARADLNRLNSQIDYSKISVTVEATAASGASTGGGGGFTLHNAAQDALRVLTVAAGVALIVLAAAIPAGLLAALGWWIAATVRRRRREHTLDLA
jgi:hypothetical protein